MAVAIVTATAVSAQKDDSDSKITVSIHQTDQEDGYEGSAEQRCGIRFNLPMAGVVKIEVESVDGLPLAGTAITRQDAFGKTVVGDMAHTSTIITYISSEKSGFHPPLQSVWRIQVLHLQGRSGGTLFRSTSESRVG